MFFLYRPVLYFFLHKDMEYAIQPPGVDGTASDHSPWVMESCRNCIENAALIVQLCRPAPTDAFHEATHYWLEFQLLFAAYLVLLQVRTHALLEPYLRAVGDVERLMDGVEEVFNANINKGPLIRESLAVLVTARRNFDTTSPGRLVTRESIQE